MIIPSPIRQAKKNPRRKIMRESPSEIASAIEPGLATVYEGLRSSQRVILMVSYCFVGGGFFLRSNNIGLQLYTPLSLVLRISPVVAASQMHIP